MNVRRLTSLAALAMGSALFATCIAVAADDAGKTRPADMAGSWYPGDAKTLAAQVGEMLAAASPPKSGSKPVAIISPHAGYRYSGQVAATGYRCLSGHTYKRVIVLAFSHQRSGQYQGVDVPADVIAYETPLGRIPVDQPVVDALLAGSGFQSTPGLDRGEHSLELQLPFLQSVLGPFQLVPMYVGRLSDRMCTQVAQAIEAWLDEDTLLVASSDFTHYGTRFGYVPFTKDVPDRIQSLADQAAAPIQKGDYDGFASHLATTKDTICGRGPIRLLLRILSLRGGASGVRVAFDTSGNQTGNWSSSVTYQSFAFTEPEGTLPAQDRATLLTLARRTVKAQLRGQPLPTVDPGELSPKLRADGACFVTLQNHGALRGCIGNMVATGPLHEAVVRNAVSACQDRRFVRNPVTAGELNDLHIEISYLTPMKRVEDPSEIIVGRHGILITRGMNRGVLLPQVAYERGWLRDEFLSQTCRKAGLDLDAWKQPGTRIETFTAEVFGE